MPHINLFPPTLLPKQLFFASRGLEAITAQDWRSFVEFVHSQCKSIKVVQIPLEGNEIESDLDTLGQIASSDLIILSLSAEELEWEDDVEGVLKPFSRIVAHNSPTLFVVPTDWFQDILKFREILKS